MKRLFSVVIFLLTALAISAQSPGITSGVLPGSWATGGPNCVEIPEFQVHEYNQNFYVLRQSGCSHFEKPFLYLIFGSDKVLLTDTGAGSADVAAAVKRVISAWLSRNKRERIDLVVVHTHAHDDHFAGDSQFKELPFTTVVATSLQAVQSFFGFNKWPEDLVQLDLGDRVLDVIAIPGHEKTSIALYDRQTGILLTGDTLYPGRLYVEDGAAFSSSIRRLVKFTEQRPVSHILGNHIENLRMPFVDYPAGTRYQPDEHGLELGRAHLLELDAALGSMSGGVKRLALRDFTIFPVKP